MGDIKDFAFPLKLTPLGSVVSSESTDAIADIVAQIILTQRGERVYRPDFGSQMRRFVFEPINVPQEMRRVDIERELRSAIVRSESIDGDVRARVRNVSVVPKDNIIDISVDIIDISGQQQQLSFGLAIPGS